VQHRGLSILPTASHHQNAGPYYKSGNNEGVLEHFILVASGLAVDLKVVNMHVEFDQLGRNGSRCNKIMQTETHCG
jgi:hypothetical protein